MRTAARHSLSLGLLGEDGADEHWRIGVVAQSHAVVENMLSGVVKTGLDPTLLGKGKTESKVPTWTPLKNVPKYLDDHVVTGCVIGGTAWDFANENTIARDLLDIDEAGQFSLAPTIGVSVAARRLLLLGDPQQLPQVSQGTHAEPVDESALGWLMDGHDTIQGELGYFLGSPTGCIPNSAQRSRPVLRRAPPVGTGRSHAQVRLSRAGTPRRCARPHRKPHRVCRGSCDSRDASAGSGRNSLDRP